MLKNSWQSFFAAWDNAYIWNSKITKIFKIFEKNKIKLQINNKSLFFRLLDLECNELKHWIKLFQTHCKNILTTNLTCEIILIMFNLIY